MSDERYLISYYSVTDNIEPIVRSMEARASESGGTLIVPPILNQGPIENPATPDYTSELPGQLISVTAFSNRKDLNAYVRSNPPSVQGAALTALVAAKIFKPMPLMPEMPVIGSVEHRHDPSFILLNGISMNSMANPMTMIRMMRYMGANFAKLQKLGVVMLASFETVDVLHGEFPFDMLFLTEWPSDAVFDQVHSDRAFVELAGKTRNRAFNRFADDRGVIQFGRAGKKAEAAGASSVP